jgi:hypothetical protein
MEKVMVSGHGPVERALRVWLPVGFFPDLGIG